MATEPDFTTFDSEDILKAWLQALHDGLGGQGRSFAPEVIQLDGENITHFRGTIKAELQRRRSATKGPKTFNKAAFEASTRVARDLGRICGIMADATDDKVVTLDVFQRAKALVDLHPSCPARGKDRPIGGGPFC